MVVIIFFKGQDRNSIPAILYEIAQTSSLVSRENGFAGSPKRNYGWLGALSGAGKSE
jgi:hypothetical protein